MLARTTVTASHLVYDRRVPAEFLRLLKLRRPLGWMTKIALEWPRGYPTDLGLRASTGEPRATLYLGTTKAIDAVFRARDGAVRFKEHALKDFGEPDTPFDAAWSQWLGHDELRAIRGDLEKHVRSVIEVAPAGRTHEGRLQALLGRTLDRRIAVVDREVEFSKKHAAAKVFLAEQQRELRDIARATRNPGDKIDALGVGADNELFVIEVKPGAASRLGLTPLQVAMYARLVEGWCTDDQQRAVSVLNGMLDQREQLQLNPRGGPRLTEGFSVTPVIAVGLPIPPRSSGPAILAELRDRLSEHTPDLRRLQVWTVGGITRLAEPSLSSEPVI